MALRTQVDPYILIGDSLADLPSPGAIAQGTLFHEEATGTCRVLVIDPLTQVRTWEDFCGGGSGATGPTGPTGPAGGGPGALLKFSALAPRAIDNIFTVGYLADAGNELQATSAPQNYPLPAGGTAVALAAFVDPTTPFAPGSGMLVTLTVNGVLTTLAVAYDGTLAPSGLLTVAGAVPLAAGDIVDVAVTPVGSPQGQVRLGVMVQIV